MTTPQSPPPRRLVASFSSDGVTFATPTDIEAPAETANENFQLPNGYQPLMQFTKKEDFVTDFKERQGVIVDGWKLVLVLFGVMRAQEVLRKNWSPDSSPVEALNQRSDDNNIIEGAAWAVMASFISWMILGFFVYTLKIDPSKHVILRSLNSVYHGGVIQPLFMSFLGIAFQAKDHIPVSKLILAIIVIVAVLLEYAHYLRTQTDEDIELELQPIIPTSYFPGGGHKYNWFLGLMLLVWL